MIKRQFHGSVMKAFGIKAAFVVNFTQILMLSSLAQGFHESPKQKLPFMVSRNK